MTTDLSSCKKNWNYNATKFRLLSQSIVFSERKSFELMLFSDDIRKYGLIKAMNKQDSQNDKIEENTVDSDD